MIVDKSRAPLAMLREFLSQGTALVGFVIVVTLVLFGVLAPWLAPYGPQQINWGYSYYPPSAKFLLGTDDLGRDILSSVIWGARTSIMISAVAISIFSVVGILLGVLSGYFRGKVDALIMGAADVFLAIPLLFLLIAAVAIFELRSIFAIMIIMGFWDWPRMARIVRSQLLTLRERVFIQAATSMGATDWRIIFVHLLPNAISPIIVTAALYAARAILYEASLSFLGLGDPTIISWGYTLSRGRNALSTAWWIVTFPGLAIFAAVLGLNLMGDRIRDLFDVRSREMFRAAE